LSIKLYQPGSVVWYQGRSYTVNHVLLRGYDLLVYLNGLAKPLNSRLLEREETEIDFNRSKK
jgi:hypothetical protein